MHHIPVLLKEVINYLDLKPGKFIIDGTIGEGGYGLAILEKISPGGILLGIDLDKEILKKAAQNLETFSDKNRIVLVNENYSKTGEILRENKLGKANGLVLDLGFSSFQLENGKGFSFAFKEEPLIMTYREGGLPAWEFLENVSERELGRIIRIYGEDKNWRKIARAIKQNPKLIMTNKDLKEIIEKNVRRKGKLHPATKTFMALRIFLNKELDNLNEILTQVPFIIKPGGRVVIVSYHALEDRIVKIKFKEFKNKKLAEILTKKPIIPSQEEIKSNPRARSAKLRSIKIL